MFTNLSLGVCVLTFEKLFWTSIFKVKIPLPHWDCLSVTRSLCTPSPIWSVCFKIRNWVTSSDLWYACQWTWRQSNSAIDTTAWFGWVQFSSHLCPTAHGSPCMRSQVCFVGTVMWCCPPPRRGSVAAQRGEAHSGGDVECVALGVDSSPQSLGTFGPTSISLKTSGW